MKRLFLISASVLLIALACGLPNINISWDSTSVPPLTAAPSANPASTTDIQPGITPVQPPIPETPAAPVVNPTGFLVDTNPGSALTLFDTHGNIIQEIRAPGLGSSESNYVHLAGGSSAGLTSLPLVYLSWENGSEIRKTLNDQVNTVLSVPFLTGILGVPGQPILSYYTADFTNAGLHSQIVVSSLDSFASAVPEVVQDDAEGWAIRPLGIELDGGVPSGLWYTRFPMGIGGDIVFEPRKGLFRLNMEFSATATILDDNFSPSSLSADFEWVAYSTGESSTGPLSLLEISTGRTVTIPLLPASDRGAGYAVFSPGSQYVAWMEGSGWMMSETPTYYPTVRVATLQGNVIAEYPDTALNFLPGIPDVYWAEPVGWLDDQTLLIQIRGENWDQSAILRVSLADNSVTYIANGSFIALLYP